MSDRGAHAWACEQFDFADLPDRRLLKDACKVVAAMAANPQSSLPKQAEGWAETMGTYRLLHNARVTPEAIQSGAIELTRRACASPAVTLMLHDLSELKPVHQVSDTKLLQYTTLAVSSDAGAGGAVYGVMHQRWLDDPRVEAGETRRQRRGRWRRSQVWPEAVEAVGEAVGEGRWIHVADREADDFQMFQACRSAGQGFVIRAQHDRLLEGEGGMRLRAAMADEPASGGLLVHVNRRGAVGEAAPPRRRRSKQAGRVARCLVRHRPITLAPPRNDSRYRQNQPMYAVHVQELDPPADVTRPLDWLLLTSEPVDDFADAMRVIGYYRRRWLIEEYHKAQKTGCRLEKTQLQDRAAFIRLAAITGLLAARLLQLREQADDPLTAETPAKDHIDDPMWIRIVSHLARHDDPSTLSVRQFYGTLARLGGHLGRKHDGRPGWQALWDGWQTVAAYVTGAHLAQSLSHPPPDCV